MFFFPSSKVGSPEAEVEGQGKKRGGILPTILQCNKPEREKGQAEDRCCETISPGYGTLACDLIVIFVCFFVFVATAGSMLKNHS